MGGSAPRAYRDGVSPTTETEATPAIAPARPPIAGQTPVPGPVIPAPSASPEAAAATPARTAPRWDPAALLGQVRGHRGLTGPGVTAVALLVLAPGVALDLAFGGSFGLASSVFFVLASLAAVLTARVAALTTAAVLPPLLFVAAVTTLAWASGNNEGSRQLGLDVGSTLAVSAPLLFATTAGVLVAVGVRAAVHLARR